MIFTAYISNTSKGFRHGGGILYYFLMFKIMKTMNFQNDVNSVLEVVKGWEIVQKTSIFSEEFNGRTFRYEFLQERILEELFVKIKNMQKNHDFHDFQDEFLGGSSYFEVIICWKMRTLGPLDVFCII